MKRRHEEAPENHERWLITYADLITLLMVFFVVLYSMSKVQEDKFNAMAQALNQALDGSISIWDNQSSPIEPPVESEVDLQAAIKETMTLEDIKGKLDKYALDNGFQAKLVTDIEQRGLVVSIQDTLLFDSGSAHIAPEAQAIMKKIGGVLSSSPNYIRVEGHTDNLPINTEKFPSNWELSTTRATNVVHILAQTIPPKRISAVGYGEWRPTATNNTPEGRAKNRRIDLIVLRSDFDDTEPGQFKTESIVKSDIEI